MSGQRQLLESVGADPAARREVELNPGWLCYSLNHDGPTRDVPIMLIERGPRNAAEIKKAMRNFDSCIVLFEEKGMLFLKTPTFSHAVALDSDEEYARISSILASCDFAGADSEIAATIAITRAIQAIPNATEDFDNRGIFSTHYLRNRLFGDVRRDVGPDADRASSMAGRPAAEILAALGWDMSDSERYGGSVSITVTEQDDFSVRARGGDVAPSYTAVSSLSSARWAILTNGRRWRLYTSRVSASSTNYFEVVLDPGRPAAARYLVAVFAAATFEERDGRADIDTFFDEGKKYAAGLEDDLSSRITDPDGMFLDIVKGVLGHDMKRRFGPEMLDAAKQTALKIMYRVWFLAYAEARELLPTRDGRYTPISLQSIRSKLDSYESSPDGEKCWDDLLGLFSCVRNGSKKHNLPQYSGALFESTPAIDGIKIRNRFIASAMHGLLESDGEPMDYSSLGVRHLGHIFETLMEFTVRQARTDIMLLRDKDGVREVKTGQAATYSYKKNDLYLASRGGIATRKMTASYYTPDRIVEFLVRRGLDPILKERAGMVGADIARYRKDGDDKSRKACMDRLLDLQVLDPAMGSGHFLVEVLNQITQWVTGIMEKYPGHPLLAEIEADRRTVLGEQERNGIKINESLLTHDVLLKRKIMKRCVFGVDLNPMAVELAKLSLWLDSFAIGVPLTYMDHHVKCGDSTVGAFLDDLMRKEVHTLDDWMPSAESNVMICDVAASSDITVEQARASEDRHHEHARSLGPAKRVLDALVASRMDPKILPRKGKEEFIHRFGRYTGKEPADMTKARGAVVGMSERHSFFHWELEMMDAFTDSRRGFDLVVGNPPWEKAKLQHDEFFSQYDPTYRTLTPKPKKDMAEKKMLKDREIRARYEELRAMYNEKGAFYGTYGMQGSGDKDLWQLVLERVLGLVADGGIVSMLIPSQILTNTGGRDMRRRLLESDILSLYVFENRKKIFPIHRSYRFALLTVKNAEGPDTFPSGFYLHGLGSLDGGGAEGEKFHELSKREVISMSPDDYVIPEANSSTIRILKKVSANKKLEDGLGDGWAVKISSGFHTASDADLFREDGKGWPVLKGRNIHQYNHAFDASEFTADKSAGVEREGKKRFYSNKHLQVLESFRLAFRDISRSTDLRTAIAAIIPPQEFHAHSINSFVLLYNNQVITDSEYIKQILYLCAVINSMTFDFIVRSKIQVHLSQIIRRINIPQNNNKNEISNLTAKLVVGTREFEKLAESVGILNKPLKASDRIKTTAKIDAIVALSYGIDAKDYEYITQSFKSFKRNPRLFRNETVKWDSNNLKEFYGEMADLALTYFKEMSE